jgi:hypothetical protein
MTLRTRIGIPRTQLVLSQTPGADSVEALHTPRMDRAQICSSHSPPRSLKQVLNASRYIYGGLGFGANETGYDDSYILSIPSFTWIQIFPTPGIPRAESEIRPHYDLSCSVIKGAQLLIIGGQFPKDPNATNVFHPFYHPCSHY